MASAACRQGLRRRGVTTPDLRQAVLRSRWLVCGLVVLWALRTAGGGAGDGARRPRAALHNRPRAASRVCGCTGLRTCLVCELHLGRKVLSSPSSLTVAGEGECGAYRGIGYCDECQLCILPVPLARHSCIRSRRAHAGSRHTTVLVSWYFQEIGTISGELCAQAVHGMALNASAERGVDGQIWRDLHAACDFDGVNVLHEIITEDDEAKIVAHLDGCDGTPEAKADAGGIERRECWTDSQSGRRKIEYGPKVNFKSETIRLEGALVPPAWALRGPILRTAVRRGYLGEFDAAEVGALEYEPVRGASIAPHIDDSWVWGERIAICSLLSACAMSFLRNGREVLVHLPRRSLLIISGKARYEWMHAIRRGAIKQRRISLTFRELSPIFRAGGARASEGQDILAAMNPYRTAGAGGNRSEAGEEGGREI